MASQSLVPVRKRVYLSNDDDLHLLREVAGQNPYEEPSRWGLIQANMKQITSKFMSERSLKDRVHNLALKFAEKIEKDQFKSGVEEPTTEIDDLLHAILLLMNEFKYKKSKRKTAVIDSSSQKGFKKREEATLTLASNNEQNWTFVNEIELTDEVTGNQDQDNHLVEASTSVVEHDYATSSQKSSAMPKNKNNTPSKGPGGNVMGRSRTKGAGAGVKHSSIKFLEKKNERWHEIRSRELALQGRQLELETFERKKRLEMEERRLEWTKRGWKWDECFCMIHAWNCSPVLLL